MVLTSTFWKDEFKYDPLGSRPRSLRLIRLLPPVRSSFPPFGEIPRIRISEECLEGVEPFDALSYTWGVTGTSLPSRPVIVETPKDQRIVKVHRSLELALLSLSRRQGEAANSLLFVDQICINQTDDDEKVSQVKLMGDIYTSCERVVIWLGPATRQSDEFFQFTSEICSEGILSRVMGPNAGHFPRVFDAVMESDIEVDNEAMREDRDDILWLVQRYGARFPLYGAADVLGRPWFNRLWVIQEVCLAPNVVFVCGDHSLCFDCLRAGILFYTIWNKTLTMNSYWLHNLHPKASKKEMRLRNSIFTLNTSFIRIFQQRKSLHVNGTRMPLYDLVLKYSVHGDTIKVGAGLPEDRIYGMLGLALDEETKTDMEVIYDGGRSAYTRLASSAVKQDLDVLLFSQKTGSEIELPSWVPDWSAIRLNIPCGYAVLGTPLFSAGGRTINRPPITDVAQGSLTVQGYFVDRIDRVGIQGLQRDQGDTPIVQIDMISAAKFFDEINEFLDLAGTIGESHFQYASNQHLRDAAAIHLADGGLSSRKFPDLFDPATAQDMIEKIHHHVDYLGHKFLKSELIAWSYGIPRIIQTIGIAPLGEVDILHHCATDPVTAAQTWIEGVRDFVTGLIDVVCASSRVQLAVWYIRMRRRYFSEIDLTAQTQETYERLGIDSTLIKTREWEEYGSNLYKTVGRRVFLTERGYLGLGPGNMRRDDVVVVLVGSSVPHVLRPRGGSPAALENNTTAVASQSYPTDHAGSLNLNEDWSYVGEAYCEGIMDGETLRERGAGEATQFRIL